MPHVVGIAPEVKCCIFPRVSETTDFGPSPLEPAKQRRGEGPVALVISILVWAVVGLANALVVASNADVEPGAEYAGAVAGALVTPLALVTAARWVYVRIAKGDRRTFSPRLFWITATLVLVILVGSLGRASS